MPNLVLSLFLTIALTFTAPVILLGGALAIIVLMGYIPGFELLSNNGVIEILKFLAIFGDGHPLQGILTLGLAGGFVGGLFDLFNFYRYQSLGE